MPQVQLLTGLRLVGVDDQEGGAAVGLLGHERPLEARGKSSTSATAQSGGLQLVHHPVGAYMEKKYSKKGTGNLWGALSNVEKQSEKFLANVARKRFDRIKTTPTIKISSQRYLGREGPWCGTSLLSSWPPSAASPAVYREKKKENMSNKSAIVCKQYSRVKKRTCSP